MGRPIKLTPEVQEAICKDLAAGVPLAHAAVRAGVSLRAARLWRSKGRADAGPEYADFLHATLKAEADAVARYASVINVAAGGTLVSRRTVTRRPDGTEKVVEQFAPAQWQVAAWFLERRADREFASNRAEVKALEKEVAELRRLVEALTRSDGGPAFRSRDREAATR